jgi:trimeric autotransporter adhesin
MENDMKPQMTVAIAGLLSLCALQAHAVCFVDAQSTGSNNGTSWRNAYSHPQFALLNPACSEIWVAKGTYKPTLGRDRSISFVINSGVAVYGGFAGVEIDRAFRNPAINTTILSGDPYPENLYANSYHVVWMDGSTLPINEQTVLDGFTISSGNANWIDDRNPSRNGGGLFCDGHSPGGNCSPTLENLVFDSNNAQAGGALYNDGRDGGQANPGLENVTFTHNRASRGGAIFTDAQGRVSSPAFRRVRFSDNSASEGGAIYNDGTAGNSSPDFLDAYFEQNFASRGGAMFNHGSLGISSQQIANETFSNNLGGVGSNCFRRWRCTFQRRQLFRTKQSAHHQFDFLWKRSLYRRRHDQFRRASRFQSSADNKRDVSSQRIHFQHHLQRWSREAGR